MTGLDMVALVLILVHLILCGVTLILMRTNKLRVRPQVFPLVLLVPIFGFICLVFFEKKARDDDAQEMDTGLEELRINDAVHRSILMEQTISGDRVVPLQEALAMDDTKIRRELIMDILYDDPSAQAAALETARSNDDVEVVHYATTAMVELQKGYDQRLAEVEQRSRKRPDDRIILGEYAEALSEYIGSGLLEGNMLTLRRREYARVLEKRLARVDADLGVDSRAALRVLHELFDNAVALKDGEMAQAAAEKASQRWPHQEDGFLMRVQAAALRHDAPAVQAALDDIESAGVYLSADGRKVVQFWRGGATVANW